MSAEASAYAAERDRQLSLVMLALDELLLGVVCLDSACPTGQRVPHMANDGGPHPHPYGTRPPWSPTAIGKQRRALKKIRGSQLWHLT